MPLYNYKCNKCEHEFIEVLKIDDRKKPLEDKCPECSQEASVTMLIGAPKLVEQVNYKRPQWFQDRLREIKKDRAHTQVDHLIG